MRRPANQRISILIINPDPRRFSGSGVSLLSILRGLDRQRFRVWVAAPSDAQIADEIRALGYPIVDFSINNWWYPSEIHFYEQISKFKGNVDKLVNIIRVNNIDVVHTNTEVAFEGAFAARLAGCHHIWNIRQVFSADLPILKYFSLSEPSLGVAMAALADKIVLNSSHNLSTLPATIEGNKRYVIPSGISIPNQLRPRHRAKEWLLDRFDLPKNSRIVVTVSRTSPEKDLETFVKVAGELASDEDYKDVRFLHCGPITAKAYYECVREMAERLAPNVSFIGPVDRPYEIVRAADAFLFTSIAEGIARSCAEALLAEVPLVTTRCHGLLDYCEHGETALLADVGDVATLTAHLKTVLTDAELASSMAQRGRALVAERYAEPIVNAQWQALYQEVVSESPAADGMDGLRMELLANMLERVGALGIGLKEQERRIRRLENTTFNWRYNPVRAFVSALKMRRRREG